MIYQYNYFSSQQVTLIQGLLAVTLRMDVGMVSEPEGAFYGIRY